MILLLFATTRDTIKAMRTCCAAGLVCRAVPVPRHIATRCGIALELEADDPEPACGLLRQTSLEPLSINRLETPKGSQ